MKTIPLSIMTALGLLFFSSCEKDKICLDNVPCSTNEYMPLAIGNYWVYENQNYDLTNYTITTLPWPDSIKVIGDTIIRDQHYFTLQSVGGGFFNYLREIEYIRDSIGYLVNDSGEIMFSSSDFDRPLHRKNIEAGGEEESYIEYAIKDTTYVKITPAGVFGCLDYRGQAWSNMEWDENIIYHHYFAKDVGIVFQSAFFTSSPISPPIGAPPTNEGRRLLKEYYIQ